MIKLIFILVLVIIILCGGLILSIKKILKQNTAINHLQSVRKIEKNAQGKRAKVEEVHNETKTTIINGSDVDHGILPDGKITKHDYAFHKSSK